MAKIDGMPVTAKINGDEGNVKPGSSPVTSLDLVLNMNPNAGGGAFKPEVYDDFVQIIDPFSPKHQQLATGACI